MAARWDAVDTGHVREVLDGLEQVRPGEVQLRCVPAVVDRGEQDEREKHQEDHGRHEVRDERLNR